MTGVSETALAEYVDEQRRVAIAERVEDLLAEMTLEEKVGQLNQQSVNFVTGTDAEDADLESEIAAGRVGSLLNAEGLETKRRLQAVAVEESRLGIPLLIGFDVIHGYRTVFPTPLAQAASWEPALAERAERIAAREATADGHNWTFAPMIDVSRDPRWGRVVEGAGEDPTLTSAFARARVRGFQGENLADDDTMLACAKHFVGYGAVEGGREYNTVDVSETVLRERHLPPFETAVEAGVATVMNAFNVHDRIPVTSHEGLVSDVLKGEWGFEGGMISDWNSFGELVPHGVAADERDAARQAVAAGSDMDMVSGVVAGHLAELVEDGEVSESRLDDAVERVLWLKGLLGLFEDPHRYFDEERREAVTLTDDHREAARELARRSFVLLKNEDKRLPLDPELDVGLVGALADSSEDTLGTWSFSGRPADVTTIREGLADRLDDLSYAPGYELPGTVTEKSLADARAVAAGADVVLATVGEPAEMTGEAASRVSVALPGEQRRLLEELAATGTPVIALLMNGRPLAIEWCDEHLPAILNVWHPGVEAGPAVADVLFGDVAPGGHLPMSVPHVTGQIPVAHDQLPTGRPPADDDDGSFSSQYLDTPVGPLYPFGHGESYTEFAYTDLSLSTHSVEPGESLRATVTVENVGPMAGHDVVQLYVHDRVASRSRPETKLLAFETVSLDPGETTEVSVDIGAEDLAFWTAEAEWTAEPGAFDLMVGHSAADIVLSEEFTLDG